MDGFLLLAFLFLVAGVVAVPIASRLGLGSVLGYLLAGIEHFAEFGVVMMLFLVGLELEPKMLWAMRSKLLGLGGLQVVVTAAAVMGIAMAFGEPWSIALAVGLVLALSSTAIGRPQDLVLGRRLGRRGGGRRLRGPESRRAAARLAAGAGHRCRNCVRRRGRQRPDAAGVSLHRARAPS